MSLNLSFSHVSQMNARYGVAWVALSQSKGIERIYSMALNVLSYLS